MIARDSSALVQAMSATKRLAAKPSRALMHGALQPQAQGSRPALSGESIPVCNSRLLQAIGKTQELSAPKRLRARSLRIE